MDAELEAWFHLYMLNRGVLLTPFHNMALLSSSHAAPTSTCTPGCSPPRWTRS